MQAFEKGLVKDYRAIMNHIERQVSGVHGYITKAENELREKLEKQLVNRNLGHILSKEDLENYYYNLTRP